MGSAIKSARYADKRWRVAAPMHWAPTTGCPAQKERRAALGAQGSNRRPAKRKSGRLHAGAASSTR
eukprot:8746863-Alexandrium_andersonii.AAC.1